MVSKEFKIQALYQTVMQILHDEKEGADEKSYTKILIFVATKYHCEYISELFKELGISCEAIYGTLDQSARNLLVSKFQSGDFNVLFATDVAARGVDIQNLNYVINFNFPFSSRMYLHRGGRCARNGQFGVYVNVIDSSELPYLIDANIYVGLKLRFVDMENYLHFKDCPVRMPQYSDEFAKDFKAALKKWAEDKFAELQAQTTDTEELMAKKKEIEDTYKCYVKKIKQLNENQDEYTLYERYQQFVQVSNYVNSCTRLELPLCSYRSFFNTALTKSLMNNQLGVIPQHLLDFKTQQIEQTRTATRYNGQRNSMENSLQQLNKQKKSASDNSADEAKRFNLRLKDSKHYLINYLETAERQGEMETQIGVYEGLLERYKVPTWELRRQARLHDNEEVRTQLAMRQIIERKQQLNRQLTQFREAREMAQAS